MTTDFFSFEGTRSLAEDNPAIERAWLAFYESWFGAENITEILKVTDRDLQVQGIDRQIKVRSRNGNAESVVTFDEKFSAYDYGNLAIEYRCAWQSNPSETWDGCTISLNKANDYTVYLHPDGRFSLYPRVILRDGCRRALDGWLATPQQKGAAFKKGTTVDERGLLSSYVIVPESALNMACVMPMLAYAPKLVPAEDVAAIAETARQIRESKNVGRKAA